MIGALATIVIAVLVGGAVIRRIAPTLTASSTAAAGFLLGVAIIAGVLLAVSLIGVNWSRISVGAPLLLLFVLLVWQGRGASKVRSVRESGPIPWLAGILLLVTAVSFLGYALFATAAPLPEFDFLTDWGLKGKVFWLSRGADWAFLQQADYRATHADYPILLPLLFDFISVVSGEWNDRWFGLLYAAFAAAALVLVHGELRRETGSASFSAFACFVCSGLVLSPWIGLADGPFAAYLLAALLLIRRALERSESLSAGALLLGCAALMKNEGVTLLIATLFVLVVSSHRGRILQLWPAVVVAGSWQLLRLFFGLRSDLAETGVISRFMATLADPAGLLGALATYVTGRPMFWIGTVAVAIFAARTLKREWLILSVVLLQLTFYLLAYSVTPHDVAWHVRWSWERLLSHLTPALTVALLAAAGRILFLSKLEEERSIEESGAQSGSF